MPVVDEQVRGVIEIGFAGADDHGWYRKTMKQKSRGRVQVVKTTRTRPRLVIR